MERMAMADVTCSLNGTRAWDGADARVRPGVRWFVPDLALFASLITLFVCLVVFDGARTLFRDSDAGWHIRTGETILSGAGLPRTDPYSLTRSGSPWFAWEWGADVMMGAAHRIGGLAGVAGLYGFAIAACTWMWFRLHWAAGGNFLLAAAMSTLLLSTGNIHWLARPHVFSWLFIVGFVWYFERGPGRLWVVALLAAVWANVHASFFFAPLIAIVYSAAHLLRPAIWTVDRRVEWNKAGWYGRAALVGAAATLVNPYGYSLHSHVIRYLADADLISRIGEYQSFNFHVDGAAQILIMLAISVLGGVLALSQRKLAHFFLAALWIAIALRSARALPIAGLLLLPLANGAITQALARAGGLQPALRRRLDAFLAYSDNLKRIDASMSGVALVPLAVFAAVALLSLPAVSGHAGFPPEQFPVSAANQVEQLPESARLLAPDMYGGYLIYRFNGRRKVFFDGRSDFYGSAYMIDYLRLIELREGWQRRLDDLDFTHALLPNRYSLVPALERLGWKKLYSDNVATLLEKH
jgi:hypothetical protein